MLSRRTFLTATATASAAALTAPAWLPGLATPAAAAVSLPITLQNNSGSAAPVYAYISGADTTGWPGFVASDGTFQRLPNPSATLTPTPDYSIALGATGTSTTVPLSEYVIGGRVWFSTGQKIQFFVNPGPGLVQPGFTSSDPNWLTDWTFCEFTYNSANLYANISYVDLVASPISMQTTGSSGTQTVSPLPAGALASIASGLISQHASDGAPWDTLVATDSSGAVLRVMAPTHATTDFGGYWTSYLDQVWSRFTTTPLTIDTQSQGTFTGTVSGGVLTFSGLNDDGVAFTQPSAADIFSCNSGPLYNSGGDARGAVAARLGAALNRSTLLLAGGENQPGGVAASQYYGNAITNHYARLVHQYATIGYAFPYDDVGPTGSAPVDGHLQDPAPTSWTIALGSGVTGSGGGGGGGGGSVSAYSTIQASTYSAQSGTGTEACSDAGGGLDVGWISSGDWLQYKGLDFGNTSPVQVLARLASGAAAGVSGAVQFRLDSTTGPVVAEIDIANTGGWQSWETVPMNLGSSATGVHDLFLTFGTGSTSDFVNIHWFTFSAT
ncbi:beta-1,3-glucanase family protein [Streptacidiphilus fuscans]|uniref:Carbohydrate-binding protein n=1 Tax=Streptacidiphilus fuscans TaxID=2789292 RepID=A0A931AY02_9ACTN|nr:beta-1,3-glucanase family protein [Streptacidiphilus fuscans]MBF9066628.1 carbohydrate-binding protein [Streptacidiphilus fuscans]